MSVESISAFSNPKYDYYRLTKDFGILKAGTIFYHDPDDSIYGSVALGCIKNCWTPDGNCANGICGGTVILHYDFIKTDWFEKVGGNVNNVMGALSPGQYEIEVNNDGSWKIIKHSCSRL